jgi:cathepsin D
MAAATNYSAGLNITYFPPDGLMGMAFRSISRLNATPVFQTLVDEHVVDCPMFAFKLANTSNGSELYLGGVNPDLYTGGFTWLELTNQVCPTTVTAS